MFWNRFILAVFACFQARTDSDLAPAARIFALVHAQGLLNLADLSDASLVLLIGACAVGCPLRVLVDAEFSHRNLHQPEATANLWRAFRRHRTLRVPQVLTMLHQGNDDQHWQAGQILHREYGRRLQRFLGRLFLTSPVEQETAAASYFADARQRFVRLPAGTVDFFSFLYAVVVDDIEIEAIPTAASTPAPLWFAHLTEGEEPFLRACLDHLTPKQRLLVGMGFDARLGVAQITSTLRYFKEELNEDTISRNLEQHLATVLEHLP